jgi:methylmalonyl-CoA/ethylmalonyl-CoA epimerase
MLDSFLFHHIGYVVNNIEITSEYYIRANWSLSDIQIDEKQNVRIAFLSRQDMPLIELIEPVDKDSPVVRTLKKMGVSPYHVCYEVDDINTAVIELKKQKYVPLFDPVEAVALNNKKICFLYNKNVGLIEIVEK